MTYLSALVFSMTTMFWIVTAASVIGLLVEGFPKPWKVVAAIVLLVLAVLLVVGVGGG